MAWIMVMTAMGTVSVLFAGFVLLVMRMDASILAELSGPDEQRWTTVL